MSEELDPAHLKIDKIIGVMQQPHPVRFRITHANLHVEIRLTSGHGRRSDVNVWDRHFRELSGAFGFCARECSFWAG